MIQSGHECNDLLAIQVLAPNQAQAQTMPPRIAMVMTARGERALVRCAAIKQI